MNLTELEEKISEDSTKSLKIPRSKHIVVNLGEKTEEIDLCVLSNTQVGLTGAHFNTSKEDAPFRINKLKAHIAELAKNPNAKVFLGGDLFYFPGGTFDYRAIYSPSYDDQIDLLVELLEPIKNKIIAGYSGTDEVKIFEKDGRDLTKELMTRLGIGERYCGQMAEVDFVFKNKLTGFKPKKVTMLFDHGFLTANTLLTVAKKTEDLQTKINGKDFYVTSHYNKFFISKQATLQSGNKTRMIKIPNYFVSVGGYRDYPNRLQSNRNTSPAYTNNGMIRVFVVPNPDRNNVRGHDYLGEPKFKVCQELVNFGRPCPYKFDFDIIDEIARVKEFNLLVYDGISQKLKQKIESLNNENALKVLNEYYKQEETPDQKTLTKKVKKNIREKKGNDKPLVIDEDGKGR